MNDQVITERFVLSTWVLSEQTDCNGTIPDNKFCVHSKNAYRSLSAKNKKYVVQIFNTSFVHDIYPAEIGTPYGKAVEPLTSTSTSLKRAGDVNLFEATKNTEKPDIRFIYK